MIKIYLSPLTKSQQLQSLFADLDLESCFYVGISMILLCQVLVLQIIRKHVIYVDSVFKHNLEQELSNRNHHFAASSLLELFERIDLESYIFLGNNLNCFKCRKISTMTRLIERYRKVYLTTTSTTSAWLQTSQLKLISS